MILIKLMKLTVNGAKTNQVFNQVFEYLAEWVDNASVQINSISDKVETLNDIEQIKSYLISFSEMVLSILKSGGTQTLYISQEDQRNLDFAIKHKSVIS